VEDLASMSPAGDAAARPAIVKAARMFFRSMLGGNGRIGVFLFYVYSRLLVEYLVKRLSEEFSALNKVSSVLR
jgi:hypothetical protein